MDENWQAKFIEAMKWEDSKLRQYVDKCQLDLWYETTLEISRKVVQQSYDEELVRFENRENKSGEDVRHEPFGGALLGRDERDAER